MNTPRAPKIAYLMSWFPAVTETFILYEILELQARGIDVEIHPLLGARPGPAHPGSEALVRGAHYHRLFSWELLLANLYWLRKKPKAYLLAWWRALRGNARSPGFFAKALVVVPKAALIAQRVQAQGVRHVHAHWATHPALAALVIEELTGIGYSFTAHAHDLYVDRSMLDEKVAQARFVVTISEFNHRMIARLYGHEADLKTFVIPCGVDPGLFRPRRQRAPNGVFTMVCVASLRDYKGHRFLIEACGRLKARGLRFRCLLVGEGVERRRIEAQIAKAGLTEIELLGHQPQDKVNELLAFADLSVLPSITTSYGKMEGVPVSLMEAMSKEIPVVATAISGVPELVEDGRTGFLVPQRDPEALATAIEKLAKDPELARKLGAAGRQTVLERFDRGSNVERLRALLIHVSAAVRRVPDRLPAATGTAPIRRDAPLQRRESPGTRAPP
ncbi:MAG: glycosyltransferase [Myxococcaceae bacterium]